VTDQNKLRADALYVLDIATAEQNLRWGVLKDTVSYAARQVEEMRIAAIEDAKTDDGVPLWLSAIIAVAVALVPIGAITSFGVTSLLTYTTNALGRFKLSRIARHAMEEAYHTGSIALITAVEKMSKKERNLIAGKTEAWRDQLRRNDVIIKSIVDLYQPEVGGATTSLLNATLQAGYKPKYKVDEKTSKLRATDAPSVMITQALDDWIRATKYAEDLAVAETRWFISTAEKLDEDAVNKFVSELQAKLKPPFYDGPDARALLQRHFESCIWCTTFDFTPRVRVEVERKTYRGDVIEVDRRTRLEPIPLKESLWKQLIERYIDPDVGKTYKEVGRSVKYGTRDEPIIFPGPGGVTYSPEVRLSVYFSKILRPKLLETQRTFAQEILSSSKVKK